MQFNKIIYQNIFWRGLNLASVFFLNITISKKFGAGLYGELFYIINTLALFITILSCSLDSGLLYYTAQNKLSSKLGSSIAVVWSVFASLISISILFLVKSNFVNYSYTFQFAYVLGMLILTYFTAMFSAKLHYIIPNIVVAFFNCILLILVLSNIDYYLFVKLFLANFLLQGLIIAVIYYFKYNITSSNFIIDKPQIRLVISYSLSALMANVLFFLLNRIDYWLIEYFLKDKELLGNYIQVSKLTQLFFLLPTIIGSSVFSLTASGNTTSIQKDIKRINLLLMVIILLACTPLIIFGNTIFPYVFGESFNKMYIPFLCLVPGIIFLSMQFQFAAFFAGKNMQKKNIISVAIALGLIIVGDVIFVPKYRITAAATMCSIAYGICSLYLFVSYKKYISKNNLA